MKSQQTVGVIPAAWIVTNDDRATMQAKTAYIMPPFVCAKKHHNDSNL